jgi:hypothetical protein
MRRDAFAASALIAALTLAVRHPPDGRSGQGEPYAASLKANVVRVVAKNGMGFGFITAIGDHTILIATAEHTLSGGDVAAKVCFLDQSEPCSTGNVVYVDDPVPGRPDLDLALIEVPYPDGLIWRPDAMATPATRGEPVWFIGRDMDWFIPGAPGRIVARADSGTVAYADLPVAEGVSGAPVVTASGIVAMHTNSEGTGGQAQGVALTEIRTRVAERRRWQWILVPKRECAADDASRQALTGRSVVVHFDWARPAPALDAMAALHCLGARTIPKPVWTTGEWGAGGIVYRSGDLRMARALQSVLAADGRLDAHLGEPAQDAEVWIR